MRRIMCGRYTLTVDLDQIAEEFGLVEVRDIMPNPRYNIAPTQHVPVVRSCDGKRSLDLLRWGLIPSWAKDADIGNRMINARGETAAEKPAFRGAFKKRRCLVPATGFYEWKKGAAKGPKQPYHIHRKDDRPFAFAGLWESWTDPDDASVETFTILTTDANATLRPLHHRMPVILPRDAYDAWLTAGADEVDDVKALLRPFDENALAATPVDTRVNSPRHDDPACLAPVDPPPSPGGKDSLFS